MFADESAATPAWVVCVGDAQDVIGGTVACRLSRWDVRIDECLDCRHLESVSDERSTSRSCSAGDVERDGAVRDVTSGAWRSPLRT